LLDVHLTSAEEKILAGEEGHGRRKAMELLVALGDIYSAERLIPISSAQVSGASFKTIGDAGIKFLEDFSQEARATVRASVNPLGLDAVRWRSMGIDSAFHEKQVRIISAYRSLGLEPLYTCTPYLSGNRPSPGQHIAWAESSATVFANSVLGAMTNREGGPSALAAAIIGKTAEYGLHLKRNRAPRVRIDIEELPNGLAPLAGYLVGRLAGNRVPYITGLDVGVDGHKAFGAAMAASGAVSMYSYPGQRGKVNLSEIEETISLPVSELRECEQSLSGGDSWDLVAIGCPHCSPSELRRLASRLKGKKPAGDGDVWFCTSRAAYVSCPREVGILKKFGKVLCDTCMVVAPIETMYKTAASDSGKAMVYLPTLGRQKASFRTTDSLLEAISR
jgi:predicted aconitase